MAAFPGPKWTTDEIAAGLMRAGFQGWEVRTMTAITQAESLGYVWSHAINHPGSGTPLTSPACLAEGYGLIGMDSYWIPQVWAPDVGVPDAGDLLMRPFYNGDKAFSQLGMDPEWNLAMARQVFLLNALSRGYTNAYLGWTSYKNGKHLPFMTEAHLAAKRAGAY